MDGLNAIEEELIRQFLNQGIEYAIDQGQSLMDMSIPSSSSSRGSKRSRPDSDSTLSTNGNNGDEDDNLSFDADATVDYANHGAGGSGHSDYGTYPTVPRISSLGDQNKWSIRELRTTTRIRIDVNDALEGTVINLPWEFHRLCHSNEEIIRKFAGVMYWCPISSECIIKNCRNIAEVPFQANVNFPISFNHLRAKVISHVNAGLLPRLRPFDKSSQVNEYFTANGDTDVIGNSMPRFNCYIGPLTNNLDNHLPYYPISDVNSLSGIWKEKNLTPGELFRFKWVSKGSPRRGTNEIFISDVCTLPNNTGAKYKFYGTPRFDALVGVYNCYKKFIPGWDLGFVDGSFINTIGDPLPMVLKTIQDYDSRSYDNAVYDYTQIKALNDDNDHKAAWSYPNPTYVNQHPMKPIYFRMERLMNINNVQQFNVYLDVEYVHRFAVLTGNRLSYNISDSMIRPDPNQAIVGLTSAPYIPMKIFTEEKEFQYCNSSSFDPYLVPNVYRILLSNQPVP